MAASELQRRAHGSLVRHNMLTCRRLSVMDVLLQTACAREQAAQPCRKVRMCARAHVCISGPGEPRAQRRACITLKRLSRTENLTRCDLVILSLGRHPAHL